MPDPCDFCTCLDVDSGLHERGCPNDIRPTQAEEQRGELQYERARVVMELRDMTRTKNWPSENVSKAEFRDLLRFLYNSYGDEYDYDLDIG